jgi:hypothetical protein
MFTNRTQSPTLPATGLTATMDELDKTAQFWSAYQDTVKLFGPGTGPGAAVGAGAGGMKLVEGAAEVATLVAFLFWVEHMNIIDADPGAVLFFVHTLLG